MGNQELLARFQNLAIEHLRASEAGDYDLANRCVDEIGGVVRQLWHDNGSTKEGLRGLADLAKNKNPAIAMKAISYTLELFPEVAKELPRLAKEDSIVGMGAKNTLKRWKSGEQKLLKEVLGL